MTKDKAFVTVTNRQIYEEIQKFKELNTAQHEAICSRQDKTNGKVKLSFWMASTALTLIIVVVGFLLQFIKR